MNLEEEKKPGFTCPNCDFFIEITLKSLLFDSNQKCPSCHTTFTMDREESKDALKLMQRLNSVIENIESVKDFRP